MSGVPSFSSFPDLPSNPAAGPSKRPSPPTFSSFPDLDEDARPSYRRHQAAREKPPHRRRDENPPLTSRQDSGHHLSKKERRPRSKEREEEDEKRRKKEKRRKERERAEKLARGDVDDVEPRSQTKEAVGVKEDKGRWKELDDGIPWYEAGGARPTRGQYEEPFDPASSNAYFTDIVGDRDALRYGSSTYRVPRYYRDGNGHVLGLNEGLRIIWSKDRTEKGLEIAPKGKPYIPRYSSKTMAGSLAQLNRLVLRPDESEDTFNPSATFITLETSLRRVDHEDETPAYRDIARAGSDDLDDETSALRSTMQGFSSIEQDVRKQTTDTEKHVREHPDDVDTWIRYSVLHLKLTPESSNRTRGSLVDPATLPQSRASAEVTLSILARALEAHPANFNSVPLHLAYIKAAESFWSPEKVTARWQNVLRELGEKARTTGDGRPAAGMMQIWLGYIDWREGQGFGKRDEQHDGSSGVDEVIEVYAECLQKMQLDFKHVAELQAREENQLYVFLRACLFMKHAGYMERATACFQALMEITLFKPDHLRPPSSASHAWFDGLTAEFEHFWDSEAPRIGEIGAKGWRDSESLESLPHPPPPDLQHSSSDPFERWYEAEAYAETHFSFPGRATDLDVADEEDPYRVVLFPDVQPFLFPIRSPEVRLQLVWAFLSFLGISNLPPDVPSASASASDPHLNWTLALSSSSRTRFWPVKDNSKQIPWQTVGGTPMEREDRPGLNSPFSCPVKCWTFESDTLFAEQDRWFRQFSLGERDYIDLPFLRNVFALLGPLVPDPAFRTLSFAFEAATSPKNAVKLAKAVLSENRDDLAIWDDYARLERQRGNVHAARTVYATALQSAAAKRQGKPIPTDELDLWAAWAEMEYQADEDRCLRTLLSAVDPAGQAMLTEDSPPSRPSSIAMLRMQQFFDNFDLPCPTNILKLKTLHATLSSGIDTARDLIMKQVSKVPPGSVEAEEAFETICQTLYIYTSRHASPAALLRHVLELAIASYPNNTQFLSLYLWGELGNRVYGRIQRLTQHLSTQDGVLGHLWNVWAEAMSAHRTFWDAGGNGAERVRLALDKGINSITGKHSLPLWLLYIEFELLMGKSNSAKQLCYRAVASIGGAKALYMLPFQARMRPYFTVQDLREWAQLMIERGVRVRVPFEQFFDPTQQEGAIELPEDEELQEDELQFLRDREEAKPY